MRFQRHPKSAARIIDGHAFVVTREQDRRMHTLGRTATSLWNMAERPVTATAVAKMLTQTCKVDLETALDDVNDCVDDLINRQILRAVS
jgi:hypothetical protein